MEGLVKGRSTVKEEEYKLHHYRITSNGQSWGLEGERDGYQWSSEGGEGAGLHLGLITSAN